MKEKGKPATQDISPKNSFMSASYPAGDGFAKAIRAVLTKALDDQVFEAVMMPLKVPKTEAFAWTLLDDTKLLEHASPLPPVMTIQGGKALSELTKHGELIERTAVLLRPCETRAAVELFKLKQINLENITLISIDCPGAVPLSDYLSDPENQARKFQDLMEENGDEDALRPVCRICDKFSIPAPAEGGMEEGGHAADVHIGFLGQKGKRLLLFPLTEKGRTLVEGLGLKAESPENSWETAVQTMTDARRKNRQAFNKDFLSRISGPDSFSEMFDACINCHNCMRACPICYCQQCYYDSEAIRLPSENYLERAKKRGGLRFPLDTLLFHLGRMSHMVLSCVSCGACEDACPASIPVGQIFSLVGDQTQSSFEYVPGINRLQPLPLQAFREDEFCEVEIPCECGEGQAPSEVNKNA